MKNRINAFSIDITFIIALNMAFLNAFKNHFELITAHLHSVTSTSFNLYYPVVDALTTVIIFLSYFTLSFYFSNGQTIGKKIFKLKVHSRFDMQISIIDSLARAIGYLICMFSLYSLFLIPFFRKDKKGIPDWFSQTFIEDESLLFSKIIEQPLKALPLLHAYEETIILNENRDDDLSYQDAA